MAYVTLPVRQFVKFLLTAFQGTDDGEVIIDMGALTVLYSDAVRAAGNKNNIVIEDGVVYVRGQAIHGFDGGFVELLETLLCKGSLRLEDMFRFFPQINQDGKNAKKTLRNHISLQNRLFDNTGIAVLADGRGNFKIYGLI